MSLLGDEDETLENVMYIDFETWNNKKIKKKHRKNFSIYVKKFNPYQTANKNVLFFLF